MKLLLSSDLESGSGENLSSGGVASEAHAPRKLQPHQIRLSYEAGSFKTCQMPSTQANCALIGLHLSHFPFQGDGGEQRAKPPSAGRYIGRRVLYPKTRSQIRGMS